VLNKQIHDSLSLTTRFSHGLRADNGMRLKTNKFILGVALARADERALGNLSRIAYFSDTKAAAEIQGRSLNYRDRGNTHLKSKSDAGSGVSVQNHLFGASEREWRQRVHTSRCILVSEFQQAEPPS
jgi:hypothetical protein